VAEPGYARESGGGASGIAVAFGIAGAILVISATRNRTVPDTLRALLRGQSLQAKPGTGTLGTAAGSQLAAAVAASASSYVDKVPYQWGGETPDGWDCSGFVTWVLHHDNGIDLPDNTHTTALGFYNWSGAATVPREQCGPGDLVCWVSHVGIAVDHERFANAPTFGKLTRIEPIWKTPAPLIRRPLAYLAGTDIGQAAANAVLEGAP
jgi:cell wall-associated NlpC family hydrolase